MHDTFSQLEQRRDQILQQMKAIDRLRRGSLSRQFFKKPRSASKVQQGPYYVLQGYIEGQKFSERVPADQAPQIEPLVANYKRFEKLAGEFVDVTDQLTRLSQAAPDAKKKLQEEVGQERFREANAFIRLVKAQWQQQGVRNLEAVELGLREAIFRDLCKVLEELLSDPALPVPEDCSLPGEKCHAARSKEMLTLFGPVPLSRNYYHAAAEQAGRVPLDRALGLWEGYSPGVVRLVCRAAARFPFETASDELKAYCGLEVEGRQMQRIAQEMGPRVREVQEQLPPFKHESGPIPIFYTAVDGTGVPMVPEELEGRVGKQPDGSAKTREVKLGCIFTQTTTDQEGLPLRDYQSTSYVAGFEAAADFMVRVRQEALRRRMAAAWLVVLLGDGAAWIWEQGQKCFPMAFQILDLYHALEHLCALTKLLEDPPEAAKALWRTWREQLLADEVAEVLCQARQRATNLTGQAAELAGKEIGYFENNQGRMLYGTYRALGFFYGSGVVEAGCKTLIGGRCKASGMRWSETGATHVLELRCSLYGNQFDQVWDRLNQSDYLRLRLLPPTELARKAA